MSSDSPVKIRTMVDGDISFGLFLATEIEEWNYSTGDFQRLLHYAPEGCFIAEKNGKKAGIATTTPYGRTAWIGTLIVHPSYRGKGIGRTLMEHAVNHLEANGIETIRLDAVKKAVPLYKSLGFEEEFESLRFAGKGSDEIVHRAEKMKTGDLPEVVALDKRFTGLNREKVLRRVLSDFPDYCFMYRDEQQKMTSFIMAKLVPSLLKIGPWICEPDHPAAAVELLRATLLIAGENRAWAGIGTPSVNGKAVTILLEEGFEQHPSSTRMVRGKRQRGENNSGIFGIGSPEKG
ncbi:MAG: GNAT family N-acetyltransferase [Candidatus Odinarchaeota archaeon]